MMFLPYQLCCESQETKLIKKKKKKLETGQVKHNKRVLLKKKSHYLQKHVISKKPTMTLILNVKKSDD